MYLNFFYSYIRESFNCFVVENDAENEVIFDHDKINLRIKFNRSKENEPLLQEIKKLVENSATVKAGPSLNRKQVRLHFVKDRKQILPDGIRICAINKQSSKLTKTSLIINIEAEEW